VQAIRKVYKHLVSQYIYPINLEVFRKMADMVVVRSKIKELAEGMNVAGDFAEALNEEVVATIQKACTRAKANKRSTIQPRDL
tara:strand:- start:4569 stop:4817 length:249 start_codon:yes stop_codon:yes gene_type:complete